jgi:Protein of unknown function (DUF3302)
METAAIVMGESSFDWLWWLCLVIVIGIFIGIAYLIFWLGKLPGETAHARGHPQASAISVGGWLGLIFPPLWPLMMIWAHSVPQGRELQPPPDLKGVQTALKETTARIKEIERDLGKAGTR